MNMHLVKAMVPATLLEEAREAARIRGISVAALLRDALTMRLDVQSLAEPIKQELAAEVGAATEAIRHAGREFYASAEKALTEMADERAELASIVNQLVLALGNYAPASTASTTQVPVSAVKRAPGSAPR
jgi:hypothetical protein